VTHATYQVINDRATGWRAFAAFSGYPDSLFFPQGEVDEAQIRMALEICGGCKVTEDCLEYALESNQRSGIWGGTTEKERRSLRRRWLADRKRSA
jgi:WhiB family redox-sensing transcriptional regulator